ncbi:hypothetical protein AB0H76_15420 [Nocardia sp. NPDC050712]|uniref:LtfC-like domain-containing protein n=1 Tax=Nocardia sp. NPDC050712 TaxID=3155518 RepID=UPI003409FC79
MTVVLGMTSAKGELPLVTGSDYQYVFHWTDPDTGEAADFPDGAELYYLIGAMSNPSPAQWDFVIDGDTATIKKESTVADVVAHRTPFRLLFKEDTTPTTETVLVYGLVRRVEPR